MGKRVVVWCFLLMIGILSSCVISGEQEERLNAQLGKYIEAHNQERLLELIGATEPHVVRYYKQQGDSVFINSFKDYHDGNKTYFENPIYRETKSEGTLVQRKYQVAYYTNIVEIKHEYGIFAISDDGGDNWLFVREKDYNNPKISGFKRLFH
jgi:hypothetical protein